MGFTVTIQGEGFKQECRYELKNKERFGCIHITINGKYIGSTRKTKNGWKAHLSVRHDCEKFNFQGYGNTPDESISNAIEWAIKDHEKALHAARSLKSRLF